MAWQLKDLLAGHTRSEGRCRPTEESSLVQFAGGAGLLRAMRNQCPVSAYQEQPAARADDRHGSLPASLSTWPRSQSVDLPLLPQNVVPPGRSVLAENARIQAATFLPASSATGRRWL